ncbi:MAG TPA: type II CRISPR-associated endonuclease Cas1 [Bacillus bacterium]|nr:type II CRISPR-associated endonuclease Cas1 [Bacillus sp. (in: firmicutes)]
MSWRHIIISNNGRLSVKRNQLVIQQNEMYTVPLQDIASILIEAEATTITTRLLSECANQKVSIISCDEKKLPNGIWLSFNQHSRQLAVLQMQLALSKPFKKRIWQAVVQQKITNQALCLEFVKKEGMKDLRSIAKTVESGDKTNREAYAAKKYFEYLFEKGFTRRADDPINRMLNYGYAIMRGAVARVLSVYGFNMCLGLFHDNQLNAFNLADDLMEVYRPMVDLYVSYNVTECWDIKVRTGLVNLLNHEVLIAGERCSITTSIDSMVKSLVTSFRENDLKYMKLPELLPLKFYLNE